MFNYKIGSIVLIFILIIGFSGNNGIGDLGKSTSNAYHIRSLASFPLASAESDDEKDKNSSDKSSEQDNSNNSIEYNKTQSEHEREYNKTQSEHEREYNKTQSEHEREYNKTQSEHEREYNKTQSEHERESEIDTENEHNNINATHEITEQDRMDIENAKTNETIAAEVNFGAGNVEHKSIDNQVEVQTENVTGNSVSLTINATSGTGPKVILINLNSTTVDVSSIKYMHILYDGHPITPATNIDEIMHTTNSDQPRYAILITQSGAQILISIPHFSSHTITLSSIPQVNQTIPEFPASAIIAFASMTAVTIAITRKRIHF